ncbi:glycosyl transferase [Devosia limi DSM 17137]|uniref:Glycosyl transferase n=1 Tax=Devosia limi DSM 17137 TaxID=1121477 RepID=A0A0F5LEL9_9HYPH|nr:glycosyltransferase [Devosia limi]KKB80639.1 glycosyl transferase [Devosia limi DSM 17137]SHE49969.1 Glycosyltransferase, GT2 family [Devosia limi DSM 17137]
MGTAPGNVGVVVIGRNEGQRLVDCIDRLGELAGRSVYVDSGSSDGSQAMARARGVAVIDLDTTVPFTAARARNAGFSQLTRDHDLEFVQFVDGDCMLDPAWIETARDFLDERPDVALVCGRRRERYPDRTIFNAMCDREWDGPIGEIAECGGDFLVRVKVFQAIGGFRPELIAGEEPELCVRLRERGGLVWRLPAEMTLHDANIVRLGQWWRRAVRSGHAFAEVSALHRDNAHGIWRRNVARALGWSAIAPTSLVLSAILGPSWLLLLLAYPADICRQAFRMGASDAQNWRAAAFSVLGKFAECQGIAQFYLETLAGRRAVLIEYK